MRRLTNKVCPSESLVGPIGRTGMDMPELTAETVRQNLKDAGFTPRAADEFLDCWQTGNRNEQLRILARQRSCLLVRIHRQEKQISCLDYLAYCLRCSAQPDNENGR